MINYQRSKTVPLPEDKTERLAAIKQLLFGPAVSFDEQWQVVAGNEHIDSQTYAVIDALHRSDIAVILDAYETDWQCLWKGESAERFALHAPYIVRLEADSEFTDWLLTEGYGQGWGIFLRSYFSLAELTHHLRKFNQVYDAENKKWLMFRYYSPDTVKNVLPYLPGQDFLDLMKPINQLLAEDGNNRLLVVR